MVTGSGIFSCFPVDAVLYQTVGDEIYPAKEGKWTNYEEALGKDVRVIERVDNLKGTGKAMYNGMEWTARSEKRRGYFLNQRTQRKLQVLRA